MSVVTVVDGEARMPVDRWMDYASRANDHFNATKAVKEHADLMVEQAIADLATEEDEYQRSYLQGRKDALRVILTCVADLS